MKKKSKKAKGIRINKQKILDSLNTDELPFDLEESESSLINKLLDTINGRNQKKIITPKA